VPNRWWAKSSGADREKEKKKGKGGGSIAAPKRNEGKGEFLAVLIFRFPSERKEKGRRCFIGVKREKRKKKNARA